MFDVGASELLLIVIVAVVVIGPKDMPLAMRTAGRWIGKMRKISGHFRAGIDAMVREAELEDMERKWREQNEAIMKANPVLPDINDMQAPTASPSIPQLAEDKPVADGPVTDAGADKGGPAKPETVSSSGKAEFHLPPPPP
ncbi:Sec-independent protein translocase protein TatB [Novosphingobium aerophilum]|uniref:Sec-independent protein translocase protein TatB n=1 Tax=Novosphingobium TaxID=165696 RepID=UPI002D78642B|nr:Sec-independent protein translocase protein TatB [Novosphingobium sp. RL4]WRT93566.1 Sec-independent protein translocase protein TatB [Novosphingobium sp. RL4]